ncbi:MAG: TIR domain-containing protein [Candidatus Aminicenantes bacterium]|nr:TIR domain-containing protein [Candidatus Aminicenantes bacterium]NIM78627.1 TIR domain-containing protein [Candidatus Aminicenantes bacterium]NIN17873.1 TIR domain-containing protein [Candidatus Aminicenantes bacterium]NIN41777.1 TIR domain-containing protein [Candidatus Aminicenantes bacterium]NIN84526.1 TIR domain-containing protein [Candidatus Aminicenantes bacterium]
MFQRNWEDDDWKTLIHTISRRNCILMLGPDASPGKVNGQIRPLTEILANELAEKVKAKIEARKIDPGDLLQVAHYYCMEAGRNGLEAKVEMFYEERLQLTSDFHNDLAALPFYFAITAYPDRMFYNALREAGREPVTQGYNFRGAASGMVTMGSIEAPLLFNLYGCIDEPESLVLTENDLLDFLIAVVSGNPPLPKNVVSELHAVNKSFLFLGFGFKHWYLRVLLHVLKGDKKEAHSFALEEFPQDEKEFQRTILFFQEGDCKIHFYNKELKSFVKELRERYEKEEGPVTPGKEVKPPPVDKEEVDAAEGPTVFICHTSENKEFAGFLYVKLKGEGFNPWLDKESLRGGDEWDEVIEKAIEKEIDYVVILQSRELVKKFEGYVIKEINMALDRQETFRRGIRFIIPVRIDDSPLLEELEHLHTIDLSARENVGELIKTIRRDQMKRKGDL